MYPSAHGEPSPRTSSAHAASGVRGPSVAAPARSAVRDRPARDRPDRRELRALEVADRPGVLIEKPACAGLFRSRPVSRILSRVTIHLCSYPAPRRAASAEPVRLAPDGVWLAAASPRSLVGSYPTVSPLPASPPELRRRRSVFCATFRRLSPPPSRERPALRCPDFPRRRIATAPRSPGLRRTL